jgi:hypothetical protein
MCWYPTILGTSDTEAAETAMLCYALWRDKNDWRREFLKRPIRFVLDDSAREAGGQNGAPAAPSP